MGFSCGIAGLPNAGKSTLFNALTRTQSAQAANYPFCTIEPNKGEVAIPDSRLEALGAVSQSARIVPPRLAFTDIAGLVKGASQGEGLGNRFLAHIRETDALLLVLRCFEDGNVAHVHGRVDPIADAEIVETELMLADLQSLEKRLPALEKKAKQGDKEARLAGQAAARALACLSEGERVLISPALGPEESAALEALNLLSSKPVLYVCNLAEQEGGGGNDLTRAVEARAAESARPCLLIAARMEEELSGFSESDRRGWLKAQGVENTGLDRLIRAGYDLLRRGTFFTSGPQETRGWTFSQGASAEEAAALIHTDFAKGFIRAETISCEEFISCGGEAGAREKGKMRLEGRDYEVQDGDVIHFRFNV